MVALDLTRYSLDARFDRIVQELRRIPDQQELEEVPYFNRVLQAINATHGSFENYLATKGTDFLEIEHLPFPSGQQLHTMVTIAERERVIIGDEPGTRKTAAAGLAKYTIEEKLGKRVKTVVLCPGYLMSNWMTRLDEYHTGEVNYCVISPDDKWEDLKRAARDETDFIFVSYDLLYKELNDEDEQKEAIELRAELLAQQYRNRRDVALEHYRRLGANWGVGEETPLEDICLSISMEEAGREEKEANTVFKELIKILTDNDVDETTKHDFYLIADEFHNVRDISLKKKTNAFYELAQRARFAAFLSGTKTPDNIGNIAVVASIVDNQRFPTPKDFVDAVGDSPHAVRRFYGQWEKRPVLTTTDIGEEKVPQPELVNFRLNDLEQDVYFAIQNNPELGEADKLLLLRYATLDIRLVSPRRYLGSPTMKRKLQTLFSDPDAPDVTDVERNQSTRYATLDAIIEGIPQEDKFVIFSKYSLGVIPTLEAELTAKGYNIVRVDQTISAENKKIRLTDGEIRQLKAAGIFSGQKYRVDLRKAEKRVLGIEGKRTMHYSERDQAVLAAQCDPDVDGILATYGTLREGKDLTAANHVILLDREYQPGVERQAIGRVAGRSGQKKSCHIYEPCAEGTQDMGIRAHVQRKTEIIHAAETCEERITREDALTLVGKTQPQREREIRPYMYTSHQFVRMILGNLAGSGTAGMEELIRQGLGRAFAENYNYRWELSTSANIGRLVAMLLTDEEKERASLVELGSGPAQMARILRRSTTCVDYLEEQLEVGKREAERLGVSIEAHRASVHDMPFLADASYGLSVASNVLNLLNLEERLKAVKENKRILAPGRRGIWVFPPSATEAVSGNGEITDQLKKDFIRAGFELDEQATGRYVVTTAIDFNTGEPVSSEMRTFVLVGTNTQEAKWRDGMFELRTDYSYGSGKKATEKRKPLDFTAVPVTKSELCIAFRNLDTGLSVDAPVQKAMTIERARRMINAAIRKGDIRPEEVAGLIKDILGGKP